MRILNQNFERSVEMERPSKKALKNSSVESSDKDQRIIKKKRSNALSEADIREKLENRAKKKLEKKKEIKAYEKEVKSELNVDEAAKKMKGNVVNAQGEPIASDVQSNDPKDPAVRQKLKDVLQTGAFTFNEKEKAALAHILKDD